MAPARSDDLHRTLVDRVARRVEGGGVPRAAVDAAVGSVLAALERRERIEVAAPRPGEQVAAVTARSVPDLASRLRAALAAAGVTVGPIGIAAAGSHNVATLRVPAGARAQLDAAAAALGATVSVVGEEDAR